MAKKVTSQLYELSRTIAKVASMSNDADNLVKGRFDKIISKRFKRAVYKQTNKLAKAINRKINL